MLQTTMTSLKAKKNSKKGFTLMEMLIVVAIIAILVAVSIPMFTSQLTKAKQATDDANMRAAKAVAVTMYMTDASEGTSTAPAKDSYYDAAAGKFTTTKPAAYGKITSGTVIQVSSVTDGTYAFAWVS